MILVETSIWIEHFRTGDARLAALLEAGEILIHPLVIGELACGNLAARSEVLGLLGHLQAAPVAGDPEALEVIERHRLMGRGIGYTYVHLLASALLAGDARLWIADARLWIADARLWIADARLGRIASSLPVLYMPRGGGERK